MDTFENTDPILTEQPPQTNQTPSAESPRPASRLIRGPRAGSSSGAPQPERTAPARETLYTPPTQPVYTQPVQHIYTPEPQPVQEPQGGYTPAVQEPQPAPVPQAAPAQPQPAPQPPVYRQPAPQPASQPRPQAAYAPPPPPPAPAEKPKKKGRFWKSLLSVVLILALVGGSCFATAWYLNRQWETENEENNASLNAQLQELQARLDAEQEAQDETEDSIGTPDPGVTTPADGTLTPAQVYAQNVQSVVAISCTVTTTGYFGQTTTGIATGSGFIVTSDGYIVTNYHVVEDAQAITVTTNAGTVYEATYVGGDSNNDVAVLKVEASDLPTVTIGSSDELIVGDQVVAIGNPLGELTNTLTVGYVSAKDRAVTTDSFAINMIQTDAAINSGNSGGPLFNMYGEVIGITSAKYSGESSSGASIEGIGFAIPIDDVIDLINTLISGEELTSGYLGVSVSDYIPSYASYYALSSDAPTGAIVREVVAGYCAETAGIQLYDIIVELGGHSVTGVNSLTRALRYFSAGDTTTITVYRDGALHELTITLDERPADLDTESTEGTEASTTP